MSDLFDTLQERYLALLARKEKGETGEEFMQDASSFIADAQRAGAATADVGERSQLRAWMRFLANTLYDATDVYPDTSLQPLARGQLIDSRLEREERRTLLPPLGWALVGAAVLVLVVSGAVLFSADSAVPPPTPIPITHTPVPSHTPPPSPTPEVRIDVGAGWNGTGDLALSAKVFCTGTTEIVAQFIVPKPLPADVCWGWQLTQAGYIATEQSSLVWDTESTSSTVRVARPDGGPFAAGQHELTFLVDDQPVAHRIFDVLAVRPQVSDVQVSNVPTETGRTEFEAGIPIIYVAYDYQNFCPGRSITRTIYRSGREVYQSFEEWAGTSDGSSQLDYYREGGLPLPGGEYQVTIGVGGQEPQQVMFTITGPAPPAFSDVTLAQGVQSDGQPILRAPEGNRFDWNTKAVYAFFNYVGMSDGLRWAVVWTRNDEEVARAGGFWNVEADGTEGERWAVYYDESVPTLPNGRYSVTLSIDDKVESTKEFTIGY